MSRRQALIVTVDQTVPCFVVRVDGEDTVRVAYVCQDQHQANWLRDEHERQFGTKAHVHAMMMTMTLSPARVRKVTRPDIS